MARDYKSYKKPTKRSGGAKPLAIAAVVIVIIVLLIAGFHKISQRKLLAQNNLTSVTETKLSKKEKAEKKQAQTNAAVDTAGNATGDSATQAPEIKFEFYSILQNEKVVDGSDSAANNSSSLSSVVSKAPSNSSTPTTQPTTEAAAAKSNEKNNTAAVISAGSKATAPVTSTAKPVTLKKSTTAPTIKAVASDYSVQVVSVRNLHDADAISHKLKSDGFNVQTLKIKAGEASWYRIQVGPYRTMDEALSAQMTLRKNNYHAILLKPKA